MNVQRFSPPDHAQLKESPIRKASVGVGSESSESANKELPDSIVAVVWCSGDGDA